MFTSTEEGIPLGYTIYNQCVGVVTCQLMTGRQQPVVLHHETSDATSRGTRCRQIDGYNHYTHPPPLLAPCECV